MRKQKKGHASASEIWMAVAILLICVMLTASVAGSGMVLFTYAKEPDVEISVLPPEGFALPQATAQSNASEQIAPSPSETPEKKADAQSTPKATSAPAHSRFLVSDKEQTWQKTTQIDIFRSTYENGERVVTVVGRNGDKVVAPGTSNTYLFYLNNDGDVAIDYTMLVTATVSDNLKEYTVPVRVRLFDETGAWLCGSADAWKNFSELNGTTKNGVLGAGSYSACFLEWEWPFESGDDEFDTLLGDLAVEEDLVLTIRIDVSAQYNPDPSAPGGNPQTGDDFHMEIWILLMILSFVGFIIMVIIRIRRKKRGEV